MSKNTIRVDPSNTRLNSGYSNIPISGIGSDHSNTPLLDDGIELTTRDYNLHSKNGIVIFLDVLGMKEIQKRFSSLIEVVRNWNSVIRSFRDFIERYPPNSGYYLRVLSDTIIITIPTTPNDSIVNWTFDLLLQPFIQSIKMRMLLRGSISYGPYYLSDRLIIGDAIDDAASCHNKLKWVGVSLSPTFSNTINTNNIDTNSAIWYNNIPLKGSCYSGLVLNWPIHDRNNECYSILQHERSINVDPGAEEKYDNTFKFYHNIVNG